MGGLFDPICMLSSTEGASPPENMNRMHADLQIEVENSFSSMIEKRPSGMLRGSIFLLQKNDRFDSPGWIPINCPYYYAFSKNKYDVFLFI